MYSKSKNVKSKKLISAAGVIITFIGVFISTVSVSAMTVNDDLKLLSEKQEKELVSFFNAERELPVYLTPMNNDMSGEKQYHEYIRHKYPSDLTGLFIIFNEFNNDYFFVQYKNGQEYYDSTINKEWLIRAMEISQTQATDSYDFFARVIRMLSDEDLNMQIPFFDVSKREWYYSDVETAYKQKLIDGRSSTKFAPNENITYAEAMKLAACMHQKWTEGEVTLESGEGEYWYMSYLWYIEYLSGRLDGHRAQNHRNEFLSFALNTEYTNRIITRSEYMGIFASVMPEDALQEINYVPDGSIPDVNPNAAHIYKLYRAGIVRGVNDNFNCNPDTNVTRAEVAAVLTRMMYPETRLHFQTREKDNAEKTVKVRNIMEFIKAVGDNTTIVVDTNLTVSTSETSEFTEELAQFFNSPSNLGNPHVSFEPLYENSDISELVISGVKNLKIRGHMGNFDALSDVDLAYILMPSKERFIFTFKNCEDIDLKGLISENHSSFANCQGGGYKFENCKNVTLETITLCGCKTEGLVLNNVENFIANNVSVTNGTHALLDIKNSKNLVFYGCFFWDSATPYVIPIGDSENIEFTKCEFKNSSAERSTMFLTGNTCKNIVVKNSDFFNNKIEELNVGATDIIFDDCVFIGNLFEQSSEFHYPVG